MKVIGVILAFIIALALVAGIVWFAGWVFSLILGITTFKGVLFTLFGWFVFKSSVNVKR